MQHLFALQIVRRLVHGCGGKSLTPHCLKVREECGQAHDQDDHEARHVSQRIAAWQSEHEAQVLRRSAAKNTERREHQRRINRDKMAENMA